MLRQFKVQQLIETLPEVREKTSDRAVKMCIRDRYKGTAQIVMPENYLAMFGTPEKDEAARIVAAANPVIDRTAERIAAGEGLEEKPSTLLDRMLSGAVNDAFYPLFVKDKAFIAGEKCIGCGACVRLCPRKNITLSGGRPRWGGNCTHCMACISYCPTQAIEYGKKSAGKPQMCIRDSSYPAQWVLPSTKDL